MEEESRMKNKHKFSVSNRKEKKEGILSVRLSVISAAAFVFCMIASALQQGKGGSYLGAVGFAAAMFSLYGCVLSMRQLFVRRKGNKTLYTGAILGGVLFILWMAVFLWGFKEL